ncbi:hypothetical protein [Methylobacterium brachythecii]|nr:hypothetical protein [Methylobacterium brachythecii]MBB3905091.1 hypothetical protein [Methylobacterium brachythecii]
MLLDRGIDGPTVSSQADWLFGPCGLSEPFTARFSGTFHSHFVTGTICATGENGEDARLVGLDRPFTERGR